MPIRPADLRLRGIDVFARVREEPDLPFDDLVYLMAEGVSAAQTKLDLTTAEVLQTLAETEVEVTPRVTRQIESDGSVSVETDPAEARSLLELGFTPTRYQFSEATVEAEFDLSITETTDRDEEREGRQFGLRAGTYEVKEQRKLDREVTATARLSARLQPVPLPVQLTPAESTEREPGGEDDVDA